MKRPLVWVGIAYVTGEALAAAGLPFWGILSAAAVILLIILTGRRKRDAYPHLSFLLPVFLLSGFVVFSRADRSQLVEPENLPQTVTLTGIVTARADKASCTALEILHARIDFPEGSSQDADTFGVILYADPESASQIRAGDRVYVKGELAIPDQARNPGQFDMLSYLKSRGFQYVCFPKQIERISSSLSYRTLLLALRQKLADVFLRLFGEREGGIACAMILGETACLPEDIRRLYQEMGIVHILAISGLHIQVAGNGLFRILLKCRISQKNASLLSVFAVISYGVLTGLSPSTARAVIMFSVSMTALYIGRNYDMMSAAALAALILFTRHPLMLTQAGMQFSFGAICALGMLLPAYRTVWKEIRPDSHGPQNILTAFAGLHKKSRILQHILRLGMPSLIVTLATIPVTAWHYFSIPLLSLPLNLVVIPAMSVLVPLCFLSGITGLLSLPAGALFGGGAFTLLHLSLLLCRFADHLPLTAICCGRPPVAVILLYYCLLLLPIVLQKLSRSPFSEWIRKPKHRRQTALFRMSFLCIPLACLLVSIPWQKAPDRIAFLDVGQGDCILLRCDGRTCLIDGGSSNEKEVGKYVIEPFLKYYGLDHVDYAFVSHADEDHISGLRQLLPDGFVRHLVLTKASRDDPAAKELADLACLHNTTLAYIEAGDTWSFGNWDFSCLYPEANESGEDRNALSMVLLLTKGSFRLLLTGDISSEQEQTLDPQKIRHCTVLKCAHHGSRFASSEEFLRAVSPKVTVISCAARNSYGHPAPETVERLTQAGSRICYTMQSGAILMHTDGKELRLRGFLTP